MSQEEAFNPLDKKSLGESVAKALLVRSEEPLAAIEKISGAGIYAIYYRGNFPAYKKLADLNSKSGSYPIYVGKAIPKGGRKGNSTKTTSNTYALFQRITQHANTILSVDSLDIGDFSFRRLSVDDIWISLGESIVIETYKPLWNTIIEGFGNHDPGAGRYKGKRPLWDEIHPGRNWADKCQPAKLTKTEILEKAQAYMQELSD